MPNVAVVMAPDEIGFGERLEFRIDFWNHQSVNNVAAMRVKISFFMVKRFRMDAFSRQR